MIVYPFQSVLFIVIWLHDAGPGIWGGFQGQGLNSQSNMGSCPMKFKDVILRSVQYDASSRLYLAEMLYSPGIFQPETLHEFTLLRRDVSRVVF